MLIEFQRKWLFKKPELKISKSSEPRERKDKDKALNDYRKKRSFRVRPFRRGSEKISVLNYDTCGVACTEY